MVEFFAIKIDGSFIEFSADERGQVRPVAYLYRQPGVPADPIPFSKERLFEIIKDDSYELHIKQPAVSYREDSFLRKALSSLLHLCPEPRFTA